MLMHPAGWPARDTFVRNGSAKPGTTKTDQDERISAWPWALGRLVFMGSALPLCTEKRTSPTTGHEFSDQAMAAFGTRRQSICDVCKVINKWCVCVCW